MPEEEESDEISKMRETCWNNALYAFGTGWILEQRTHALRFRLRLLTFLGIVVPAFVGFVVAASGAEYLGIVLAIASPLGLFQLVFSIWALAAKWDDAFAYASESLASNQQISNAYQDLASNPPSSAEAFRRQLDPINVENTCRAAQDSKQGIKDAEKRAGMRAALRQFRSKCVGCEDVPKSMKPTDCPVCGSFRINRLYNVKEIST